jgi:amino acid adenylation domain-containing protein
MRLWSYFKKSANQFPTHTALWVNEINYSYAQLEGYANELAKLVNSDAEGEFVGILAHRSIHAFAGILGAAQSGKAYVPLNPGFPENRLAQTMHQSGMTILLASPEYADLAERLCAISELGIRLVVADFSESMCTIITNKVIGGTERKSELTPSEPSRYAYMLFTSGSTGVPKGVPVSQRNVAAYIDSINRQFNFTPQDRFSNVFDLNFDLSVHDMFISWSNGASLYCLSERDVLTPAAFIKRHEISCWFSTPSTLLVMDRLRQLKQAGFPSIRLSLFCGEALHESLALKWQDAAPNSQLCNLYGPTETTIAISGYAIDPDQPISRNGILSIGKVFDQHSFKVVDQHLNEVTEGEQGELLLSGPQVVEGYWNNPELTSRNFVLRENKIWYRTGDLVAQQPDGSLFFFGRIDFQVKIQGRRIELTEIDFVIADLADTSSVVTVVLENKHGRKLLISCIASTTSFGQEKLDDIAHGCRSKLPTYMIPENILIFDTFPLNSNGKTDRKELTRWVAEKLNLT